ncbi:MAG: nitroreductase [Methanomicrobiales archaeon HGW-Methanomicrobiales-4]|nr:MAG: nitroreductase [Methanomicrobiales archaeon HGW-Methanomicrobiales-4]
MRGIEFIEYTRYGTEPFPTDEMKGITQPEIEEPPVGDLIELPEPDRETVSELDLSEAIELRESIREYTEEPMTIPELSYLLWCTAGIKWAIPGEAIRTVPSAGCCHAIDTYLAISNITGIKNGLYRYIAVDHALEMLPIYPDLQDDLITFCFNQPCVKKAAVVFLWVAESYRMTWKYGERGYRNLFLDAGHICQNLYLSVLPVNCGCCAIGAFRDQEINEMLILDGTDRFILYMATVGKTEPSEDEDTSSTAGN